MDSYYLTNEGWFKLRSKWPRRIKYFLSVLFLLGSLGYTNDLSHAYMQINHPKYILEKYVTNTNPVLKVPEAKTIVASAYKWGNEFNIDEKLILAITRIESGFDTYAISKSGALGLMQVIPVWHKTKIINARERLGNPEIFNIHTNIYLGTSILRDCFKGGSNIRLALNCYSGNTVGYADKVIAEYKKLQKF